MLVWDFCCLPLLAIQPRNNSRKGVHHSVGTRCYPFPAFNHGVLIQKSGNVSKKFCSENSHEPQQATVFCRAIMYTKNEETHLHVLPQPREDDEANFPPEDLSSLDQYPDGGWRAWLVVLGAWCALVPAFGIVNTIAVLEEWLSEHQLKDHPKSSVSWIFSLWIFFFYLGGVQVGMLVSPSSRRGLAFM